MWMLIIGGALQSMTYGLAWYLIRNKTSVVPRLSQRHPYATFTILVAILWGAALLIGLGLNRVGT